MGRSAIEKNIERLYTQNLAVRKGERVLVFTDRPGKGETNTCDHSKEREELAQVLHWIVDMAPSGVDVSYMIFEGTGGNGIEPPEPLWSAAFGAGVPERIKEEGLWECLLQKTLDNKQFDRVKEIVSVNAKEPVNVVIGLAFYSTTHTNFRHLLTDLLKVRYASMPHFDLSMFSTAMSADWPEVAALTKRLAATIGMAEYADITAKNGTHLRLCIKGVPVMEDTGVLDTPGACGNLPAGEVFLAPQEGKAEGQLVLEWAPQRLKTPVTLLIEKGEVTKVSGSDPYAFELEKTLERDRNFRNIAELGIGTNPHAKRPENILEAEKILGTIHIALGDNSGFGGRVKTPFHQDYVVFNPTVTLTYPGGDERDLLVDGEMIDADEH